MPAKGQRDSVTWEDQGLADWVEKQARKRRRSRSWVIQEAVRQWAKRTGYKPTKRPPEDKGGAGVRP